MDTITDSPEFITLFGVVITAMGAVAGAFINSWVQRGKVKTDATMALVDNLQEETGVLRDELRKLREELKEAHEELSKARIEAHAMRDTARIVVSISAGYIHQLRAHINTEQGPPAPAIPSELEEHLPVLKL